MRPALPSDRPLVLVVEDEPLLRLHAVDMVEAAGFEAAAAADASAAIEILERRTDIRIVFTDVEMPRGIDGIRLAALIRDRWPPIDIIVTSGKALPCTATLPARSVFHPKPYDQDAVIATMRRMAA